MNLDTPVEDLQGSMSPASCPSRDGAERSRRHVFACESSVSTWPERDRLSVLFAGSIGRVGGAFSDSLCLPSAAGTNRNGDMPLDSPAVHDPGGSTTLECSTERARCSRAAPLSLAPAELTLCCLRARCLSGAFSLIHHLRHCLRALFLFRCRCSSFNCFN